MTSHYLNRYHVTYYVITCKSAFDWVYAEHWYVIITFGVTWDSRTPGQPEGITNKVLKAGVRTSYVHSSKISLCLCLSVCRVVQCDIHTNTHILYL